MNGDFERCFRYLLRPLLLYLLRPLLFLLFKPGWKKILNKMLPVQVRTAWYQPEPACFPAGTLVHTREGLKPIEQIQIGDWVLSKHESGEGEREYKRITNTCVHEDRQVILIYVRFREDEKSWRSVRLVVTPEHPIWIKSKGWTPAAMAKKLFSSSSGPELLNYDEVVVSLNVPLYVTTEANVAWIPMGPKNENLQMYGQHLDLATLQTLKGQEPFLHRDAAKSRRIKPEHFFRTTVYNLEVEDFHTYHVGEPGIWVHNTKIMVKEALHK